MLMKNKDGLYECAICHTFATDNGRSLANHVNNVHRMDTRSYYDASPSVSSAHQYFQFIFPRRPIAATRFSDFLS